MTHKFMLTIVVLSLPYVLSHAPYIAVRYKRPPPVTMGIMGPHYDFDDEYFEHSTLWFYRPAEQLIDSTPLRYPLLEWGRLWGVQDKLDRDSCWRRDEMVWQRLWLQPQMREGLNQ